jgi:hypothetical protein
MARSLTAYGLNLVAAQPITGVSAQTVAGSAAGSVAAVRTQGAHGAAPGARSGALPTAPRPQTVPVPAAGGTRTDGRAPPARRPPAGKQGVVPSR